MRACVRACIRKLIHCAVLTSVCCRAGTLEKQVEKFWQQADFGYVDERQKELTVLCKPQNDVR